MITLLAAGSDGWALARKDEGLWLLRPPYGDDHLYKMDEGRPAAELAAGIAAGGMESATREFNGWEEVADYLKRKRVESASEEDLERAKTAAHRLLRRATPEQASRHLDRIESEIGDGRVRESVNALRSLLKAPSVLHDRTLFNRAVEIAGRLVEDHWPETTTRPNRV